MQYYDLFKEEKGEHDLRIATIFTYGSNEDSDEAKDLQMMNKMIGRQNQTTINQVTADKLKLYWRL
jgi:type I restriction enzyme R subunit